jgi:uncharacterized protein (TIGR02145 family)
MIRKLFAASMLAVLCVSCARTTITDVDGNVYHTVRIGNQVWTTENLRTTKFSDGTPIPHVPDSVEWHSLYSPGYCYFGNTNNADSIRKLGALYNWYCVDSMKLAPPGWHVPTDDDWDTLQNYLIDHGYNWGRKSDKNVIAKALAARSGWSPFIVEGTPGNAINDNNRSGFSGFGSGSRYDTHDTVVGSIPWAGRFKGIRQRGYWWSATQINEERASVFSLSFCVESLIQYGSFFKTCGFSVRLVKNRE